MNMIPRGCLLTLATLLPTIALAADVPTFQSGEYEITTTFGASQTLTKKACLTHYEDWFDSVRTSLKAGGCDLAATGQADRVYNYKLDCTSGASGTLAVTKLSESDFESAAEIQLPIAGFTQTISTRDHAKRIGDCPVD